MKETAAGKYLGRFVFLCVPVNTFSITEVHNMKEKINSNTRCMHVLNDPIPYNFFFFFYDAWEQLHLFHAQCIFLRYLAHQLYRTA